MAEDDAPSAPEPVVVPPSPPIVVPEIDFQTLPDGVDLVDVRKGFGFGEVGGTGPAPPQPPPAPSEPAQSTED